MAESDYKPIPCAVCGEGGPLNLPLRELCDICRVRLLQVGEHRVVFDRELGRIVVLSPVDSSNIKRAGWRAIGKSGILVLEFHDPHRELVSDVDFFRYSNVDRAWWTEFATSKSKGQFFHRTVRANPAAHPYVLLPQEQ